MTDIHSADSILGLFKKNLTTHGVVDTISGYFGKHLFFVAEHNGTLTGMARELESKVCKHVQASDLTKAECKVCMSESMRKSGETKTFHKFICNDELNGVCFPVYQGDKVYGYVIICDIEKDPGDDVVILINTLLQSVLRETQKELELKKLYDTIRPRAIALSTVHTLHRLISSTLNLNELLPRIARLAVQVMRAHRCSIKLVDSKRKQLLPKTTIDLRTQKAKLKKIQIGKWAPGKAVKYARTIRARNYISTPLIDEDVIGVVTVYDKTDKKPFTDFDEEIMRTFCEQAVIAIKNAQLYKEQERLTIGSIKSIAAILESKAPGSCIPKASFLRLVHMIGQELKLSEYEHKCLEYASLLHDAGQITLPDEVIKKQGTLTGAEYDMIKEHPKKAAIILRPLRSLKDVVPIILHHHENFDGSGYPMGLKGTDIPLGARIMGLVGAFEAMITPKPYRKPLSVDEAVTEIERNSGKQFDPTVVGAFMNLIRRKNILKVIKDELQRNKKSGK